MHACVRACVRECRFPDQGASSTFFTAAQSHIDAFSGSLIDFHTDLHDSEPFWVQSGDTCVPRPLPGPWGKDERSDWYQALLQAVVAE